MKILTYTAGYHAHRLIVSDDAKADAAYEAIKTAMNTYDRFGNDRSKTVSIETGGGSVATIRLETLESVTLDSCEQTEADTIERAVWEAGVKARITARLAPV